MDIFVLNQIFFFFFFFFFYQRKNQNYLPSIFLLLHYDGLMEKLLPLSRIFNWCSADGPPVGRKRYRLAQTGFK